MIFTVMFASLYLFLLSFLIDTTELYSKETLKSPMTMPWAKLTFLSILVAPIVTMFFA